MSGLSLTSPRSSFLGASSVNKYFLHGLPLKTSLPNLTGKTIVQKKFIIVSSKLSPVEEAIRIERLMEQQNRVKIKKRAPLRLGKVSPSLPVPDEIPRPSYIGSNQIPELSEEIQVHDTEGIASMRSACQLAARALNFAGTLVRPSATTKEIDKAVHKMIIEAGGYPSTLHYNGFPKSICTAVNECVCHGIPDTRQLQNGDIISIDVMVFLNGYHGSTSKTFVCGDVNEPVKRLIKVGEECLERGISACKDGTLFRKIGKRISEHAQKYGYGVVERFVGHGIGSIYHSQPLILHHRNDKTGRMVEGQTFTIGPILTMGSTECVTWDDGWTTVTADGSRAVKFEHTLLITKTGVEVLTKH